MARKRVAMTLDEDIYNEFQKEIVDYGYPRAAVAMFVQRYMEKTIKEIKKYGMSPDIEMYETDRQKVD
jgi:hypothetical protein